MNDIAIVTNAVYDNVPEYVQLTDTLKERYCGRHGMDYVRTSENPHPDLHPVWCKPSALLAACAGRKWVLWMDCDAAPVNLDFDIRDMLSGAGNRVAAIKDLNGLNAGVMAVPCTPQGVQWLRHIESQCHDPRWQVKFREQACMAQSLDFDPVWRSFAFWIPASSGWNSYLPLYNRTGDRNLYEKGHWALHLPALRDWSRASVFRAALDGVLDRDSLVSCASQPYRAATLSGGAVFSFTTHPHIGDNMICAGAVRNVRAAHPEILFAAPEQCPDVWLNNPDFLPPDRATVKLGKITYGGDLDKGVVSNILDSERHARHGNVVEAFTRDLCMQLGLEQVPCVTRTPVLCLTDGEKERSGQWSDAVLVNANCQTCSLSKGYPHWQRVVDMLHDRGVRVVQIGGAEARDLTIDLRGVEDMRGRTTIRELMSMVYGCRAVLSPPSMVSNVAGAFCRPQVVVNASREPDRLLDYPNAAHASRRSPCGWGVDTGCVHCGIGTKGRSCRNAVRSNGRMWCLCQWETRPERIVELLDKVLEGR